MKMTTAVNFWEFLFYFFKKRYCILHFVQLIQDQIFFYLYLQHRFEKGYFYLYKIFCNDLPINWNFYLLSGSHELQKDLHANAAQDLINDKNAKVQMSHSPH